MQRHTYAHDGALAPRAGEFAGEVGVFASVGTSFARALRDGPSHLEERIIESKKQKSGACVIS